MDQEYRRRLEKIETVLKEWLPEKNEPRWIKEIFPGLEKKLRPESFDALLAPVKDILSRGGKRWRPLLMTLVCESLGGSDASLPLSPLVEFCHNASLIHDDIEDNSETRRGKPAVHHIYGTDTAINSGCFLYFLPLACIESWAEEQAKKRKPAAAENKIRIYKLWGEYMRKLHLGQSMDINWHRNLSILPDVREYYLMCALKTGCLSRFAAELGVFAACADNMEMTAAEELRVQFGEAAEKLGIGFQILDDVKNLTTGIPGKKRGDDIVEGKKSLPLLLYLSKYPDRREMVSRCFSAAGKNGVCAPEVEELIAELTAAGALAEAEEKGQTLIAQAGEAFSLPHRFPVNEESRHLLAGMIRLIN